MFTDAEITALYLYVKHHEEGPMNSITTRKRISQMLKKVEPIRESMDVWRGQTGMINSSHENRWVSSSINRNVGDGFMGKDGSLFLIHIQPGVRVLDVHKVLNDAKKPVLSKEYEKEWIIESGGTYFKDSLQSQLGFKKRPDGIFETWYFSNSTMPMLSLPAKQSPAKQSPAKKRITYKNVLQRIHEENTDLGINTNLSAFNRSGIRQVYVFEHETISDENVDKVLASQKTGGERKKQRFHNPMPRRQISKWSTRCTKKLFRVR